jgi:hypothetical protein
MDYSKVIEEANTKRRSKVWPTLKDGYTFVADGRSGFVYFKEQDKILEVYWEMSGVPQYDVLISTWEIQKWTFPSQEIIPEEARKRIISGLRDYLISQKIRPDF